MAAEIVEHDDIAGLQGRDELLVHIGQETLRVDQAVKQRWSGFSEQRFVFDKWIACRLMLRLRCWGVAKEGRRPTGVTPQQRRRNSRCRSERQMVKIGAERVNDFETGFCLV